MNTVTVQFPGLGLNLNINPIAFTIFGRPIYWYGIIISIAFLSAVLLALKHSDRFGITQDDFLDMILFAGPIGVIGARLFYVAFSWGNYKDNLVDIIKIWEGGLAIYGGIIAGIITAIVFSKVKKINTVKLLDFAIVYIPLAQAIGRWGNFFNQEAFGTNTSLPWGMTSKTITDYLTNLKGQGINVDPLLPVHPTFLYESIWDFIIFGILMYLRKRKKVDGEVILAYFALYGAGRFFIEGLRTDSLMAGNLRISQLLSAVFVIASIIFIFIIRQRADKLSLTDVEVGKSEYAGILKAVAEAEASNEANPENLDKESIEGYPEEKNRDEQKEQKSIEDKEENKIEQKN